MSRRQLTGILGSLLLFVGVFLPIVSLPMVGGLNYLHNGRGDGMIVLVLSLVALGLVFIGAFRAVFLAGSLVLSILCFTMVVFTRGIGQMRAELATSLQGNPFASLGEAMMSGFQLQWGWAILIIGAGLLIAASLSAGPETPATAHRRFMLSVGAADNRVTGAWILAGVMMVVAGGTGGFAFAERLGMGFRGGPKAAPTQVEGGAPADEQFTALLQSANDAAVNADSRAYLKHVTVSKVEVAQTIFDRPGVFGEIRNAGNRSLDEVELTAYFLDERGNAIHEEKAYPVLVSKYSFDPDRNKPLRAGYSRKFGVSADDAPSSWAKRVRVTVTNVKFSTTGVR